MADYPFNTPAGQTIDRELLIACLNTGDHDAPVWSPIGKRTVESNAEYDWGEETSQDILGNNWTDMKKPVITQNFEPWKLDSGDEAQKKIWNLAVVQQDARALTNQDMLIIHHYANFAERYESCMVKPTSLGGEGGGSIDMPITVTYGGTRIGGSVTVTGGKITFVPEGA